MTDRVSNSGEEESILDSAMTTIDEVKGSATGAPLQDMQTSDQMKDTLKRRESLRLTRYNLGDGGWTIGYGHFERDISKVPETISQAQADDMFDSDIVNRAEKWVKLYVTVPLTQNEFDALVSIAYNMSPQSFKKFANEVNAGNGIASIAETSIGWVADKFKNGIRNRRNEEIAIFDNGLYA
ncbi:MAG: hypothetical protein NVS3B3_21440 [Aquirhabdus sp.]